MINKHPGEVLKELMDEEYMSIQTLSSYSGVSINMIWRILKKRTKLNAETAIALSKVFKGSSPIAWMQYQIEYDIEYVLNLQKNTCLEREEKN